jgi:hypothetical protein
MLIDTFTQAMEYFTLAGVCLAGIIFLRIALRAKSIGSFRFQLSVFILVWVAAEIPQIAQTLGLINVGTYDDLGLALHMTSMAAFAIFVGARSFNYFLAKPPLISPPANPVGLTGALDK